MHRLWWNTRHEVGILPGWNTSPLGEHHTYTFTYFLTHRQYSIANFWGRCKETREPRGNSNGEPLLVILVQVTSFESLNNLNVFLKRKFSMPLVFLVTELHQCFIILGPSLRIAVIYHDGNS